MEVEHPMSQISTHKITWNEFTAYCELLSVQLKEAGTKSIYAIPKNGMYVAHELLKYMPELLLIRSPFPCLPKDTVIIDDLIDSGRTLSQFPNHKKAVLVVKNNKMADVDYHVALQNNWIVFPWEEEDEAESLIVRQLEYIGEDPNREGLKDTPERVVRSWNELYAGYSADIDSVFKTFTEGTCDEMVLLKNIEFYSTCEHHILPFFGKIHIGYIPKGKVIGISKLARLTEIFARRLQIQERLVKQIADELVTHLSPEGVMVVCEAQHFCMTARGVQKQNSVMVTSAIRGVFKKDMKAREEFLALIK